MNIPYCRKDIFVMFALVSTLAGNIFAASEQTPANLWKVGLAKADITPAQSLWLGGYAMRDHPAEGAIHPLWIKAMALQDKNGHRAIIITSDILGYPKNLSDRIRDRLRESLGLERADILLNASHTHSAPVIDGSLVSMYPLDDDARRKIVEYTHNLEDTAIRVVREAFNDLKPAKLSSGNGFTRFAVNRRNNREAAILDTYNLNGPSDHAVPVLMAAAEDGTPRAVLVAYACHATVLSEYRWCGDYPGFAQIELEQAYPGAMALFAAGCGADQNPLPRRSTALAQQYGRELAAAARRTIEEDLQPLEPILKTAYRETQLDLMPPPSRDEIEKVVQTAAPYMQRCAQDFLNELDAGKPLRTTYPYCLQLWRVGGQTIAAMGGEIVVDYAIFMKQMLGRDTFVFGYSNDMMSYIPSLRVLREGGYEGGDAQFLYGMPNKWTEDIESHILDSARALAIELGLTPQ